MLVGDDEMLYAEQMLHAAMTESLSWVCGDSWFILGAMMALHHRCAAPPPRVSSVLLGPGEAVDQLSTTHTPQCDITTHLCN